jgi:hypothetical protein
MAPIYPALRQAIVNRLGAAQGTAVPTPALPLAGGLGAASDPADPTAGPKQPIPGLVSWSGDFQNPGTPPGAPATKQPLPPGVAPSDNTSGMTGAPVMPQTQTLPIQPTPMNSGGAGPQGPNTPPTTPPQVIPGLVSWSGDTTNPGTPPGAPATPQPLPPGVAPSDNTAGLNGPPAILATAQRAGGLNRFRRM